MGKQLRAGFILGGAQEVGVVIPLCFVATPSAPVGVHGLRNEEGGVTTMSAV
jgi:hypothetical protein